MYCANCGSKIDEQSRFCVYCGTEMYPLGSETSQSYSGQASSSKSSTQYSSTIEVKVKKPEYTHSSYSSNQEYPVSPKSRLITLLLLVFLGSLGIHYFYAGRIGILILTGTFNDTYGRPIVNWDL